MNIEGINGGKSALKCATRVSFAPVYVRVLYFTREGLFYNSIMKFYTKFRAKSRVFESALPPPRPFTSVRNNITNVTENRFPRVNRRHIRRS